MKAITAAGYGGVDVLRLKEVAAPRARRGEVLVEVHACSVNPIDWKLRRGEFKILTGFSPPKIPGSDFAGIVAEVGPGVTEYDTGDPVWGFVDRQSRGTYAEFVVVEGEELAPKPPNLDFEEAASLPLAGLTAYQGMVHKGNLRAGQYILVNGASGGVGSIAVQIARAMDCRVTGVCGPDHVELVLEMGADRVLDYTREDPLAMGEEYDLFFDIVANQSFSRTRHLLRTGGVYVRTLPSFESLVLAPILNPFRARKGKAMDCRASSADLEMLGTLVSEGKLRPQIEKVYPLEEAAAAHTRSEGGHVAGKLVLRVKE